MQSINLETVSLIYCVACVIDSCTINEHLLESEKEYDMILATETLKGVLSLDFKIDAPGIQQAVLSENSYTDGAFVLNQLHDSTALTLKELL